MPIKQFVFLEVECSCRDKAQVAELVDAYVSGAYVARRAGSSPVLGTKKWSLYNKEWQRRRLVQSAMGFRSRRHIPQAQVVKLVYTLL